MQSHHISVAGHPFHYLTWGDPILPPLLMLHGFPEYSAAWDELANRLCHRYFCIAPDQRGYGQSWAPPEVSEYAASNLVGDMAALIDALDIAPCTVLGHDWGSAVAYGLAMMTPDLVAKLIVVNGVSKQYAMTGFRIGWAVANTELIETMTNIQGHETSGPSALLQHAAVGAINGIQSSVESLRSTLENNRNVLVQELRAFEGVHLEEPGGTFYSFPDFSHYSRDSEKLARFLLDKVQVVTVPGKEFGREGHLRISFCGSIKEITEGIERMKWALDPNSPNELWIGERKLVRDWT